MCWRSGQISLWYDLRIDEPVMVSMDHLVKCSEELFMFGRRNSTPDIWDVERNPFKDFPQETTYCILLIFYNCVNFSKRVILCV